MKKININKQYRMKEINKLSLILQNTKLKSLTEIRRIAETIELLSDDTILRGINKGIEDFKKGRYTVLTKPSNKREGLN